jgi:hypothetical protein
MSLSEPVQEFHGELDRPENQQIIEFLKLYQPSAHADLVQLMVKSTEDLPSVSFYCPDTDNHAYYLAHTPNGIVFAAAIGMSALMYRLPKQSMSGSIVKGGEIFKEIGEPWVSFNPFWPDNDHGNRVDVQELKQWSKLAYYHALN